MNTFEDRLVDFIVTSGGAHLEVIDQQFSGDKDYDSQVISEVLSLWNATEHLYAQKSVDVEAAWNTIAPQLGLEVSSERKHIEFFPGEKQRRASKSRSSALLIALKKTAIAAAMVGAIGFLTITFFESRWIVYEATSDMVYDLPDGSVIELMQGARIRHLTDSLFLNADSREVFAEGEMTFKVEGDPTWPFYAVSELTRVEVLGTVFRFTADGHLSGTENVEGLVDFQVLADDRHAELNPRDQAEFDGNELKVTRYVPPLPPPAPPPVNRITAQDLVDVLGHQYPIRLEMAPYMAINDFVLECDLRKPLGELIADLEQNVAVDATFAELSSNRFILRKLLSKDLELKRDYTYFDLLEGKPFAQ